MQKLIALLSHSEAPAAVLLEVAKCGGQLPSRPGRLLQARRKKDCSARHRGLAALQLIEDSDRSIGLFSLSHATCDLPVIAA